MRGVLLLALLATLWLCLSPRPLLHWSLADFPSFANHLILFTGLTVVALWAGTVPLRPVLFALIALSFALEMAQVFVPRRQFNVEDIMGNLAGIALGTMVWRLLGIWRQRRPRKRP